MRQLKNKLRNLYSVQDEQKKTIALILALSQSEARKIWCDKNNHEQTFSSKNLASKVSFKELKKGFKIKRLATLLSERTIKPGRSLLCTKLSRYYNY